MCLLVSPFHEHQAAQRATPGYTESGDAIAECDWVLKFRRKYVVMHEPTGIVTRNPMATRRQRVITGADTANGDRIDALRKALLSRTLPIFDSLKFRGARDGAIYI